jgi:hypothetical protein
MSAAMGKHAITVMNYAGGELKGNGILGCG